MEKIIPAKIIDSCDDCGFRDYDTMFCCHESAVGDGSVSGVGIPSWCPLSDYEEVSNIGKCPTSCYQYKWHKIIIPEEEK